MQLSEYFNTTTDKYLITILPNEKQISNLKYTCKCLTTTREKFGPINPTSGLRKAKKKYSQHQDGYAIDFVIKDVDMFEVFKWMYNNVTFDQLIYEKDYLGNVWIHFSVKEKGNRKQAFTANVTLKNTTYEIYK